MTASPYSYPFLILGATLLVQPTAIYAADVKPALDLKAYNYRIGSQGFDGFYQFTTNNIHVESAGHLLRMGSNIAKLRLYARPSQAVSYSSLAEAAQHHPEYRTILDMPFHHYFFWTGSALPRDDWWKNGPNPACEKKAKLEMYALTKYMLTNYNNSGKTFYFGNWEGDWLLMGTGDQPEKRDPSPTAIAGMIAWLNARQQGVDEAKQDTVCSNVNAYFYLEINRVRDALREKSAFTNRVVNRVLPSLTNLDYVSYSAYDVQQLSPAEFTRTMAYIEAHLSTNKASRIPGKRIFIGEYGFGGFKKPSEQYEPTRAFLSRALAWGSPFILFWQVYNNEKERHFCLVDEHGRDTPVFALHADYLSRTRSEVMLFKEKHGRLPTEREFTPIALKVIDSISASRPVTPATEPPLK